MSSGAGGFAAGPGFETTRGERGEVFILRRGLEPSLPRELLGDLDRYLAGHGLASAGRGPIARVPVGGGDRTLLLKKYRHGGLLRAVMPDLFAGSGRMLRDLAASERARAHGVPCAAVAGLVLVRAAGPLWSGYVLTEEIADAETLDRAMGGRDLVGPDEDARIGGSSTSSESLSGAETRVRLARHLAEITVRTVRRLHDAGVLHRDLNLRNVLVRAGEVFVIDLDGARISPSPTPAQRFANLSRLDRSYVKIFRDAGPLTHDNRRALLDVYSEGDAPLRDDLTARVAAHKRSLARHRRLWK